MRIEKDQVYNNLDVDNLTADTLDVDNVQKVVMFGKAAANLTELDLTGSPEQLIESGASTLYIDTGDWTLDTGEFTCVTAGTYLFRANFFARSANANEIIGESTGTASFTDTNGVAVGGTRGAISTQFTYIVEAAAGEMFVPEVVRATAGATRLNGDVIFEIIQLE